MALAAVLLVAGCGGAVATPRASVGPTGLPAGTYTSKAFKPALSYTVPAGWANDNDTADYFAIRPAVSDAVGISVFQSPLAMSQDKACPDAGEPGVDTSAAGLAAWIRGLKGLKVSAPRLAAIGGLRGTEIDVEIADGWTFSCSFAGGLPTVPLFFGRDGDYHWVVAGTEKLRLDILDGPDKSTIVVDVDAFDGVLFDDLVIASGPITRSFSFKSN